MVNIHSRHAIASIDLSVLALSSRFDGRVVNEEVDKVDGTFSTRSVESF